MSLGDGGTPPHDLACGDEQARERLRRWGGEALLQSMTRSFVAQVPEMLDVTRRAIDRGQGREVERAAHMLRSSAAQLGAGRVETVCARIEALAGRGDLPACQPLVPVLEDEFDRYMAWVREGEG